MKHIAESVIFETSPEGFLGERYTCSCGAQSTAAQMAQTRGGCAVSAMFGHRPCRAIYELHTNGDVRIEMET